MEEEGEEEGGGGGWAPADLTIRPGSIPERDIGMPLLELSSTLKV